MRLKRQGLCPLPMWNRCAAAGSTEAMKRQRVQSSSLSEVGYEPKKHVLEVRFRNGGLYRYYEVPRAVYQALMAAESLGAFMNQAIRGHYRYEEVGP